MSADRLELKHPGDQCTMTVASCGLVPVGKYPEYALVGFDLQRQKDVDVRVPQSSFDRQIARIHKTAESVVGCTITIKRDPNAKDSSKPYWGLYLESDAGVAPPRKQFPPSDMPFDQPAPPPFVGRAGSFEGDRTYYQIAEWVLGTIYPLYVSAGVTPTAEAMAAITATLYITASKR